MASFRRRLVDAIKQALRPAQRAVRDSLELTGKVTDSLRETVTDMFATGTGARTASDVMRPMLTVARTTALAQLNPGKPMMWVSVLSASTCEPCEGLHGTVKDFSEWTAAGQIPGSAMGPCKGTVRCRCALVPTDDVDAQLAEIPEPVRR